MRRLVAAVAVFGCFLLLVPKEASPQRTGSFRGTSVRSSISGLRSGARISRRSPSYPIFRGRRGLSSSRTLRGSLRGRGSDRVGVVGTWKRVRAHGNRMPSRRLERFRRIRGASPFTGYRGLSGGHGYRGLAHFVGHHRFSAVSAFRGVHPFSGLHAAFRLNGFFFSLFLPFPRHVFWHPHHVGFVGGSGLTSPVHGSGVTSIGGGNAAAPGFYGTDVDGSASVEAEFGDPAAAGVTVQPDRASRIESTVWQGDRSGEELGGGEAYCVVVDVRYRSGPAVSTWISLPSPEASSLKELRSLLYGSDGTASDRDEASRALARYGFAAGSSMESVSVRRCQAVPAPVQ